ncbi:restriction endonuclease subunit S [Vibrio parahaemolyticus]|uniref:restriction endonuclease subunit S n=1 Tax=Vibrio parahaemolyticus TaxID=670 RepID=UPI003B66E31D
MNSPIWKSVPLSSCIDKVIDFRGKTPKKIGMEWGNGSIRALSANNVKQGYIDFKRECYLASEELYDAWMTKGDCSKGDIVFTMEAPLGNVALIPDDNKYILSQRVILLKPNESVLSEYLFHFMSSESFQNELNANATGSTAKGIKQTRLVKLKVTLPPAEEQQKIAEVLSTVDKKIDLIDQKIAETEKLKTGLIQKLFSEGVGVQDENGNWQPHTEFQDSPFGKIPKCWSVETLGEHTIKVGSGVTPKGGSKAYVDTGIPLIRSQNVLFGKFKLDDVAFITEQQHEKMKGSQLKPKDVLLNITGASIGRCAVLPADFEEGNVNQHVCIIRMSQAITPEFCGWFLNSNLGQKQIWNLQAGGNREGLNFQQIRSFRVPVLTVEEQCSIVEILSTVSDKLNLLEQQKAETQQLKKGLMQKLLTGEWRVPVEETEAA